MLFLISTLTWIPEKELEPVIKTKERVNGENERQSKNKSVQEHKQQNLLWTHATLLHKNNV